MPCFRATHATLQTVFLHNFGVVVMVACQLVTVQHVIGAQPGCIRFLPVSAPALRLLLLFRLSALARHDWYKRGVYVRCGFIHVQDCGNDVFPSKSLVQPPHTVVAPFIHTPVLLYLHHIPVRSRHHDTNSSYLVRGNLPFDACRLDAMCYRFITYRHTFGKFHQFTIKMCTCRIDIRGYHPALDVVGHPSIGCTLCFLEIKGKISHVEIRFC